MGQTSYTSVPLSIRAIGVGGGGCNAVDRMAKADILGVDFVAVNTDAQALLVSEAPTRVQLGKEMCKGLGAGGDPGRGRQAAEESLDELKAALKGAHMVFVAAGMGGGTGTGASPIIARLARESGALTIGIVTKPFDFEMARRAQIAEDGIKQLQDEVDALIVIPNERLLTVTGDNVTIDSAFKTADDVLMVGVRAISEVVTVPGLVNLDFADVRTIMRDAGPCQLSIGYGNGQNRVVEAARAAISSDLLEVPIDGATGVLYVVAGPSDLTLSEVSQAADVIDAALDEEAMVIFGVTLDPKLRDDVAITLVATGFTPHEATVEEHMDEEFRHLIRQLEWDESRLEAPAFMRRPIEMRHMSRRSQALVRTSS